MSVKTTELAENMAKMLRLWKRVDMNVNYVGNDYDRTVLDCCQKCYTAMACESRAWLSIAWDDCEEITVTLERELNEIDPGAFNEYKASEVTA